MNEKIKKTIKLAFSRVWIILALAIVSACVVYFSYGKVYQAMYEARVKIIITLAGPNAQNINIFDSMRSSQMAVGDISQIITSDSVLSSVEKECNVDQMYIIKALNINAIPNTRILDISAQMNTPELALKLITSLDKNLKEKLLVIDSNVTYKILSRPNVDLIPVNGGYPIIFTVCAALGGIILGGLINLIMGDMGLLTGNLKNIYNLFGEESILPVPESKIPKHEGGTL